VTARLRDFPEQHLQRSRRFFELMSPILRTRAFEVITCVVGLPIARELQDAFAAQLDDIVHLLPAGTRIYRVGRARLHWEAHIVKRPDEPVPSTPAAEIEAAFTAAVRGTRHFELDYQGFFVSSEGTVCFQGFGDSDELRARLREQVVGSSAHQLVTTHISGARILDPVGPSSFARLIELRDRSAARRYGTLPVDEVKLVAEHRWYMERYRVLASARLRR
jgi:hypothetical protein